MSLTAFKMEQEKVWGNLGDWLGPEDNKNDKTLAVILRAVFWKETAMKRIISLADFASMMQWSIVYLAVIPGIVLAAGIIFCVRRRRRQ